MDAVSNEIMDRNARQEHPVEQVMESGDFAMYSCKTKRPIDGFVCPDCGKAIFLRSEPQTDTKD